MSLRHDFFPAVGMRFRPEPYTFDGSETRIRFEPEPTNPHDGRAIKVLIDDDDRHVAYVARTHLEWLHQLLPRIRAVRFSHQRGLAAHLRVTYADDSPSVPE